MPGPLSTDAGPLSTPRTTPEPLTSSGEGTCRSGMPPASGVCRPHALMRASSTSSGSASRPAFMLAGKWGAVSVVARVRPKVRSTRVRSTPPVVAGNGRGGGVNICINLRIEGRRACVVSVGSTTGVKSGREGLLWVQRGFRHKTGSRPEQTLEIKIQRHSVTDFSPKYTFTHKRSYDDHICSYAPSHGQMPWSKELACGGQRQAAPARGLFTGGIQPGTSHHGCSRHRRPTHETAWCRPVPCRWCDRRFQRCDGRPRSAGNTPGESTTAAHDTAR